MRFVGQTNNSLEKERDIVAVPKAKPPPVNISYEPAMDEADRGDSPATADAPREREATRPRRAANAVPPADRGGEGEVRPEREA